MSPPSTSACQAVALGLGHSVVPRRGTCSIRAVWLWMLADPGRIRPDLAAELRAPRPGCCSTWRVREAPGQRWWRVGQESGAGPEEAIDDLRDALPCGLVADVPRAIALRRPNGDHRVELGRVQIDAPQIGLPRPASQQDCLFVGMQLTTDRHFAASWRSGCGAPGETRTHDLLVRNQMLYPLSYGRP